MARYWLHYHDGVDRILDPEGADLSDLSAAHQEAVRAAREIMACDAATGVIKLDGSIDVADADGNVLLKVRFDEAVEIRRSA